MPDRPLPVLTPAETRVLGVLIEKQLTVPDTYPLTLNALVTGCNQKSSRDPVMSLTEGEVQEALDSLRRLSLVIESSGSRTMRYSHNAKRVLGVPTESVALLATLMLRGPQTSAELRANAERLQRFSDASALEAFLDELAAWPAGALVLLLPRQPGARESRWAQLLSGPPSTAGQAMAPVGAQGLASAPADGLTLQASVPAAGSAEALLARRVDQLEAQLQALQASVAQLCEALGVEAPPGPGAP